MEGKPSQKQGDCSDNLSFVSIRLTEKNCTQLVDKVKTVQKESFKLSWSGQTIFSSTNRKTLLSTRALHNNWETGTLCANSYISSFSQVLHMLFAVHELHALHLTSPTGPYSMRYYADTQQRPNWSGHLEHCWRQLAQSQRQCSVHSRCQFHQSTES